MEQTARRTSILRWCRALALPVAGWLMTAGAGQANDPRPGTGGHARVPAILSAGRSAAHILERIAAAGDTQCWPGAGRVTVFDSVRIEVEQSGLSHRFAHTLQKVLTRPGAVEGSILRFDYDPASNWIAIRSVRIHRPDSTFVDIDPTAAVDCFAPAGSIFWGMRMKVLGLPRLEPGDAVEVETYQQGFQIAYLMAQGADEERFIPPMRGHFYDSVLFGDRQPIKTKHYRLTVPREKLVQYAVYNGEVASSLVYTDTTLIYEWWTQDRPAVAHEVHQPKPSDFVPKVVLATVPDWPAKSRWFFRVNEPVFAWNEEIQAQVDALLDGLEADEEKFGALTHWVADNIRYSGLSMGPGEGYTIHPSVMTWEDRCGVCKDKAGMLVTFLRAAGYTSYPAMTMAGARVEQIPADQFNHCVVAVQHADSSFTMLDPTWVPHYRDLWSKAEGEQHYVTGSPRGEDLQVIRSFDADESRLTITLRTEVGPDGSLAGSLEMVGVGYMDGRLRGGFLSRSRNDRRGFLVSLLVAISPAVQLETLTYAELDDYTRPMQCTARFRVPGYAAVTDSTIDFHAPSLRFLTGCDRFLRWIGLPAVEDREHPALFWATGVVTAEEELQLPRGYEFAATDLPACNLRRDAATFTASSRARGKQLLLRQRLSLEQRTVAAAAWADLAQAADSLQCLADDWLQGVR